MLAMLVRKTGTKGYTKAVDFWSLGVLMFKLLTGKLPFKPNLVAGFVEYLTSSAAQSNNIAFMPQDYAHFYKTITEQVDKNVMSEYSLDIVTSFLKIDEKERLGSHKTDMKRIKVHPCFATIQWGLLEQGLVEPPYYPPAYTAYGEDDGCVKSSDKDSSSSSRQSTSNSRSKRGHIPDRKTEREDEEFDEEEPFESFERMMCEYGRLGLMHATPVTALQKHFNTWDYTAPSALQAELGVQHQKEQLVPLKQMPSVGIATTIASYVMRTSKYPHLSEISTGLEREHSFDSQHSFEDHRDQSAPSLYRNFSAGGRGSRSYDMHSQVSAGGISLGLFSKSRSGIDSSVDSNFMINNSSRRMAKPPDGSLSPSDHSAAASFGITKNAVAVHQATNLLRTLELAAEDDVVVVTDNTRE